MLKRLVGSIALSISLLAGAVGVGSSPALATEDSKGIVSDAQPRDSHSELIWPAKRPSAADRPGTQGRWANDNHALPRNPKLPSTLGTITREYGVGSQALSNTGIDGNMTGINPFVSFSDKDPLLDGHSIAEWTISSDSQAQQMEWGLRKSYGGGNSKFFVGTWVNGVFAGYNANVTLYAGRNTANEPGDDIPAADINTNKSWAIQWDGTTSCSGSTGAWWFAYNGGWVGYVCKMVFPVGSGLRNGTADFNQVFGEITYDSASPHAGYYCSDMGRGNQGSLGAIPAAFFGSVRFFGNATTNPPLDLSVRTIPASPVFGRITVSKASNRTFYYGGPGSNSTNTAVGTVNAC